MLRAMGVVAWAVAGATVLALLVAASGRADPAPARTGRVIAIPDRLRAAAAAPDGKVLLVGVTTAADGWSSILVLRYDVDGRLDPTFGSGGRAAMPIAPGEFVADAVVQRDGAIVVAGSKVVRIGADGLPDSHFGEGGVIREGLGPGVTRLAVQPDGKIVAALDTIGGPRLVRFDAGGRLDADFGVGGNAPLPLEQLAGRSALLHVDALAVGADGTFAVSASGAVSNGSLEGYARFLVRLRADGSPDTQFGIDGAISIPFPGASVTVDARSRVLVGEGSVLGRYRPDGRPDLTFGDGGFAVAPEPPNRAGLGLALQPDGKVVTGAGARFNVNGSVDRSFAGGVLPGPFPAAAAVLPAQGRKVVFARLDFTLARYLPNGSLDPSFYSNGRLQRPGNPEIEAIRVADGRAVNLTRNAAADVAPAVSPNGRTVAFLSWRRGAPDIYAMQSDGSGLRRLTRSPFQSVRIADFNNGRTTIAWSPNGREIAFDAQLVPKRCCAVETSVWFVYVMHADGSGLRRVARDARSPSWSPDGKRLAVWARIRSYSKKPGRIDVVAIDSRQRRTLANGSLPAWSPRGRSIAYTAGKPTGIRLVDADGSGRRTLAGHGWRPVWSHDGNRIAFYDTRLCVNCGIGVIDVRRRRVRHFEPSGANAAQWAPDDRRLTVVTFTGIESFDPAGRRHRRLLVRASAGQFESLSWAPDGRRLFVGLVPTH